jgi:hypothetical protein
MKCGTKSSEKITTDLEGFIANKKKKKWLQF